MQTISLNDTQTNFGVFLDLAQHEPVRVMRNNRVIGFVVSADDYEAMREFYAQRLQHQLDETAEAASRAGLTPEILDTLLADES
ncbi:Antitoxin Phd_YefM, type II toxin-antitoxin system [Allochromatium warmingii]|uniref:Antitoxin n=2 Tax=Allochromatium warmingii TaxID=61595 RepID=A0A1H3JMC4_ALLWA|nr:Antitoxin Phd_YefM, type II toxin-antitoxin system [Allochromatium warmingii]